MLYDDAINIRSEEQRQEFFNSTGYDGVILKTDLGTDNEYIVLTQTKSKNVDNTNPNWWCWYKKITTKRRMAIILRQKLEAKGTKTRLRWY